MLKSNPCRKIAHKTYVSMKKLRFEIIQEQQVVFGLSLDFGGESIEKHEIAPTIAAEFVKRYALAKKYNARIISGNLPVRVRVVHEGVVISDTRRLSSECNVVFKFNKTKAVKLCEFVDDCIYHFSEPIAFIVDKEYVTRHLGK
jgi:hypothetical protein